MMAFDRSGWQPHGEGVSFRTTEGGSMNPTIRDLGSALVVLLGLLSPLPADAADSPLTVRRLAGWLGGPSWMDGPGSVARFRGPQGIAVTADGTAYVADSFTCTLRVVSPAGVVTTLAGSPYQTGAADGTGSAARFSCPIGVALGPGGDLFVTDGCAHQLRRVTPAGAVTTVAGAAGQPGSTDGTGSAARFDLPSGVAVDPSGNVYVSDTGNQTIRRVTPAGVVSTVAGSAGQVGTLDGTGSAARFDSPFGLAWDPSGSVVVADSGAQLVRRVTPDGVVTTVAGGAWERGTTDGPASQARFDFPRGVAVDATGATLVSETMRVRRISASGTVGTLAGSFWGYGDGTGWGAKFDEAQAIGLDAAGNALVADYRNHAIRRVTPQGAVTTVAGSPSLPGMVDGPGSAARFAKPAGLSVDPAGNVIVADLGNRRVRRVSPAGEVTTLAGGAAGGVDGTGSAAGFLGVCGGAVDPAGNVYLADTYQHTIRKVSPAGVVTTLAGSPGVWGSADGNASAARFNSPLGVALDAGGNLYVADSENHTIRKVTPSGDVGTLAGKAGHPGAEDGPGSAARFSQPAAVVLDADGNVVVADAVAQTIRKVLPSGSVTTLAGKAYQAGSEDGTGSAARFWLDFQDFVDPEVFDLHSRGLAADGSGNVYVADFHNHTIRKVTREGVVTTVVGAAGDYGSKDGAGSDARLRYPAGLAADARGNLWIADTGNHNVRTATTSPWGCTSDTTHLCLLGGRFRVSVTYQDYAGNAGIGSAVPLTEDTGYFWFFDERNVEVIAKMVRFCDGPTGNVGVYANGLTDLRVDLRVEDLAGSTPPRAYTNPLGSGFRLIRDGAFPCSATAESCADGETRTPAAPSHLAGDALPRGRLHARARGLDHPAGPYPEWDGGEARGDARPPALLALPAHEPTSTCSPDEHSLCLLNGRYRVTADYRDYGGGTGPGQAVPLTSDTGYFWFFDARNVEVVAKLVSFCGSSTNKVAVYANGLTDLEVNVHVTDTVTSQRVTYTNQLGTPFELIREGPFACP